MYGTVVQGYQKTTSPKKAFGVYGKSSTGYAGYFDGNVTIPAASLPSESFDLSVSGSKQFRIAHPSDPSRYLVHASLEGPENAVFYRGEGQLKNGSATIKLPDYFEALTREEGRTVLLTRVGGFDRIAVKTSGGAAVRAGQFTVYSNNPASNQRFVWEVKAVRGDIAPLEAEPIK